MPGGDQAVGLSHGRFQLVPRVLCFVTFGDEVLLLKGAANKKIWPGKYNGLGGHVERGETVLAAARREILEEARLEVKDLRLGGVITIETGETTGIGLFVFTATAIQRSVHASAEGTLEWVPLKHVAELDAVEDLPRLLAHLARPTEQAPPWFARYFYDSDGRLQIEFDN